MNNNASHGKLQACTCKVNGKCEETTLGVFSCSRSQRKARDLRMEFDEMNGVIQCSERASKVSGKEMVHRIDGI